MQTEINITTPKDILSIVQFNAIDKNWKYKNKRKDMYAYQAEGVAGITNRLNQFGLAILADEVGMGKTFQALATIAYQLKKKPKSKILVFTPRKEVLTQWKDVEYEEFKNKHLIEKKLLPELDDVDELENLKEGLNPNNKKIVFAKVTSLSYVNNYDKKGFKSFEKCINSLKDFDLIIIDEAHLFRNYENNGILFNDRTNNANKIFSQTNSKILLMTATPLHSKPDDILHIVSVFNKNFLSLDTNALMKKLMIRRLRIMSNGMNKYSYRQEQNLAVSLSKSNDKKDELFFALLQKTIIQKAQNHDLGKSKHLLNLLEGRTFDENIDQYTESNREIKKIVESVVRAYKKCYKKTPSNQKYESVLNQIGKQDDKALVFVRRKASAFVLAKKSIEEFDKFAWRLLSNSETIPKRDGFDRELNLKGINSKIDEFAKYKAVREYFTTYKEHISLKSGTRDITIFRHMANEYFDKYSVFNNDDFKNFQQELLDEEEQELLDEKIPKSKVLDLFKTKKSESSTSASRFVKKFDKNKAYADFFTEFLPKILSYEKHIDKYELIKSAILHSSIGVVELFTCDMNTRNYKTFCNKVKMKNEKENFLFVDEIKEFIEHFDNFKKYLKSNNNAVENDDDNDGISSEEKLDSYDVKIFHNSQPSYPYLSETKNKSVIARFNSPFFPKMLCGTSTLQEGLNLHLFCNKVYHFGSAYSVGDDEQRTGRVDRIHGKMDRELCISKESKLNIYYPYLEKTFDEENLRVMLCNKRATEEKIDKCQEVSNSDINMKIECEKGIADLFYNSTNVEVMNDIEPFDWKIKKTV